MGYVLCFRRFKTIVRLIFAWTFLTGFAFFPLSIMWEPPFSWEGFGLYFIVTYVPGLVIASISIAGIDFLRS
jgi:hypothetical protein